MKKAQPAARNIALTLLEREVTLTRAVPLLSDVRGGKNHQGGFGFLLTILWRTLFFIHKTMDIDEVKQSVVLGFTLDGLHIVSYRRVFDV